MFFFFFSDFRSTLAGRESDTMLARMFADEGKGKVPLSINIHMAKFA